MSLSYDEGLPLARIINEDEKSSKIIYLNKKGAETDENIEVMINELLDSGKSQAEILQILAKMAPKEIKFPIGENVSILPAPKPERVFIAARSGMGKSTIACGYIQEYRRMFPDNEIFLISRHEYDPVYDDIIKDIGHLVVDDNFLDLDIGVHNMANSLVVFDDVDNLQSKKISDSIHKLVDDLISNGLKYGIYVLYLGHQLQNYSKTRNLTNEANKVIFFPGSATYHAREFLSKKIGLEKVAVNKILNLKTRWVCLNIMLPQIVIYGGDEQHNGGVFII